MQCSDTNGELPAIHISKEMIQFAMRVSDKIEKIKELGGRGDTELRLRVKPNGHIKSIGYSFDEPGEKESA